MGPGGDGRVLDLVEVERLEGESRPEEHTLRGIHARTVDDGEEATVQRGQGLAQRIVAARRQPTPSSDRGKARPGSRAFPSAQLSSGDTSTATPGPIVEVSETLRT